MREATQPEGVTYGRGAKKKPARQVCGRSIANPREQKSLQLLENKGKELNSIANFSGCAALARETSSAAPGSLATRPSTTACPERGRRAPGPFISDRYTVRTEIAVTPTKQRTVVLSDRYTGTPPRGVGTSARNSQLSGPTRSLSSTGRAGMNLSRTELRGPRRKGIPAPSTACACSPAQAFVFRSVSSQNATTPPTKQST
jgi:hypothetical protein